MDKYSQFRLCYVSGRSAWFTTRRIDKQWGDDWDDAPYEHNAGDPYGPTVYHRSNGTRELDPRDWARDGTPRYQLLEVLFNSDRLRAPADRGESVSVRDVNAGKTPWLEVTEWQGQGESFVLIDALLAGATFSEFCAFVEQYGGTVFVPLRGVESGIRPKPVETPCFASV